MDQNPKQQIVERVKGANNVLVTVSTNPSVDQLASAIGLSLMLTKLGKHATAVFSGSVPSALTFLEPNKTLEGTVDSLRDFIISLDKEKADKLRYKVEGDVVKIFITPYRTKISKDDLNFDQGDFNVDVVIALGVSKRDDLDEAIKAHGRILHDATIVTINTGSKESDLGAINWQDPGASCLSEMLVSISEAFQGGLLDQQISTAFLTGIVSATDRFSNDTTSPKVMTMAAQLMAAGANQQLIANNLGKEDQASSVAHSADKKTTEQPSEQQAEDTSGKEVYEDEELSLHADNDAPVAPSEQTTSELEAPLSSNAKPRFTSDAVAPSLPVPVADAPLLPVPKPPQIDAMSQSPSDPANSDTRSLLPDESGQGRQSVNAPDGTDANTDTAQVIHKGKGRGPKTSSGEPTLGGTFNATSDEARREKELAKQRGLNNQILSHPILPPDTAVKEAPSTEQPVNDETSMTPALPPLPRAHDGRSGAPVPPSMTESAPAVVGENQDAAIEEARKAVADAASAGFDVANSPLESIGAQVMPGEDIAHEELKIDEQGNIAPPPPGLPPSTPPPAGDAGTLQMPPFMTPSNTTPPPPVSGTPLPPTDGMLPPPPSLPPVS